ncbi:MAG TPA: DUF2330 domain-containing protein [Fimbriimonas sp.]|nr:DUF2330 domain-containing protein [Fimbriimonas sp.]
MAKLTRILGFSLALPALIACCAVSPMDSMPSILSQRNVIVWDAKTKTEHFIRQAAFETETKDFGFIVASPTLPKVSEVESYVFNAVRSLDPELQQRLAETASNSADAAASAGAASMEVDVLQVEDAGAYTITTLRADDSSSLEKWLKENKYNVPKDIQEWLDAYIAKKWLFSAFKFKADRVDSMDKLPCLSFKTDEPFAPYRVPRSNRTKTESLEIFFISDQPYGGFVQDERQNIDHWCSRIRIEHVPSLEMGFENKTQIPAGWVASYMKADFPTAAPDDMVFRPVKKEVFESPSVPSEINYTLVIAGVTLVGLIAAFVIFVQKISAK